MAKKKAAGADGDILFRDSMDDEVISPFDVNSDADIEEFEDDDDADLLKDKNYGDPQDNEEYNLDDDEEEEDDDEGGDDDETDEEKEQLRREAEDRRAEAEREREEKDQKDHELAVERHNNYVMQLAFARAQKKNISTEIRDLKVELDEKDEEGDTREKQRLQEKIDELSKERDKYDNAITTLESKPVEKPGERQKTTSSNSQSGDANDPNARKNAPATKAWLAKNDWYMNPANQEEQFRRNLYTRVDNKLLEDFNAGRFKHPPTTNEYYNELERRAKVEKTSTRSRNAPASGGGNNRKSRTAPVSGANAGSDQRQKPTKVKDVKLDKGDLQMSKMLGINLKDPKVNMEYKYQKLRQQRNTDN